MSAGVGVPAPERTSVIKAQWEFVSGSERRVLRERVGGLFSLNWHLGLPNRWGLYPFVSDRSSRRTSPPIYKHRGFRCWEIRQVSPQLRAPACFSEAFLGVLTFPAARTDGRAPPPPRLFDDRARAGAGGWETQPAAGSPARLKAADGPADVVRGSAKERYTIKKKSL